MSLAIVVALLLPLSAVVAISAASKSPDVRESLTVLISILTLLAVVSMVPAVQAGDLPQLTLFELVPGLSIQFTVEPLGLLFALVASGLWTLSSLYSFGYMRGNNESHQTRFYNCFAISIAAAMGIAFAGNMLTLFLFYEALTLATWPLVTHKGDADARRGGRVYLGLLLCTSIGLLLPGIIYLWTLTGTLEFTPGGVFSTPPSPIVLTVLVVLFMFGIGKAALMPFHRWLPGAMVAPTPVSALLHAVAVVKAGVFSVLKVTVYLFGLETLSGSQAAQWLGWAAAITILLSSLIALRKDNLKARLAYSTISQLSYVVLAAAIATPLAIVGGALQIVMHAMGKITLFFCAGSIYTATHETNVSRLDGLGRRMPWTFAAFFIGSLSIIGLPPLGGVWSKWFLLSSAANTEQYLFIAVLLLSSLLNIAYLMPIVMRGFFKPARDNDQDRFVSGQESSAINPATIKESPLLCVGPLVVTAIGCVVLFFSVEFFYSLIMGIFTEQPVK